MNDQISLFDGWPVPGDYVEQHGRQLTFDEIAARVGQLIVMDRSTQSHPWYMVVRVVEIYIYPDGRRRLIYNDGSRSHGLVDEMYFDENRSYPTPSRAFALA